MENGKKHKICDKKKILENIKNTIEYDIFDVFDIYDI
jgi:hypothetical protein